MTIPLALARRPLRRAVHDVRYVPSVSYRSSRGTVRRVYRETERDFGLLAPPVALHAPVPSLLAAVWELLRSTLVVDGATTRAQREAVAAEVSRVNRCPYCVEVHDGARSGLDAGRGESGGGHHGGGERGGGESRDSTVEHPELVAVRSTFEYLNRMVTVFLPTSPLPASAPAPARRLARSLFGAAARRGVAPAAATLSAPELLAAVAAAADSVLGAELALAVQDAVAAAMVRPPALAEDPASGVAASAGEQHRAAVRLAVLVAVAPERVADAVVAAVRDTTTGDADALIVALAAAGAARAAAAATPIPGSSDVAG